MIGYDLRINIVRRPNSIESDLGTAQSQHLLFNPVHQTVRFYMEKGFNAVATSLNDFTTCPISTLFITYFR